MTETNKMDDKYNKLMDALRKEGKAAVAFSGGVDSTFLLKCALDAVGADHVLALTADSPSFIAEEHEAAAEFAKANGIKHIFSDSGEFNDPDFIANTPDRCYFCKKGEFSNLLAIAKAEGYGRLMDGTNASDTGDYRPGMRATAELGVISPLKEAGLTKPEIRELSKRLGLQTWDKPAYACLASRIPYGEKITVEKLALIGKGEKYLRGLGFRQCRIRLHGGCARIEVEPAERRKFFDEVFMDTVAGALREIGFTYAALDLTGYRTGSLNESLKRRDG